LGGGGGCAGGPGCLVRPPARPPGAGRRRPPHHDPLERLLQDHGVRGIAWRAAQLPTDQHRDKVAEWLDMLLESVKRPES
ncbi:hypothetical protein ACFWIZ_12480, partial [Streptomyces sp. NPDC127044]